jgi:hypothetical protein
MAGMVAISAWERLPPANGLRSPATAFLRGCEVTVRHTGSSPVSKATYMTEIVTILCEIQ